MARQVTGWLSEDGEFHGSRTEADAYESDLETAKELRDWLESAGYAQLDGIQLAVRIVKDWQVFRRRSVDLGPEGWP